MFLPFPRLSLCSLFVLLLQLSFSWASPLLPENLNKRAAQPYCTRLDIVIVDKILTKYSKPASSICSKVLNIPAPTTTTVTTTAVTQTISATATSHVTFTTTFGLATESTVTTTTSTTTVVSTTASTATSVQNVVVTSTTVIPTSDFATVPGSTTTVTVYTAAVLKKRAAPSVLADVVPDCPPELRSVILDIASKACNCFVTIQPASTTLVTATTTVTSTANIIATDSTVIKPSSTTTVVSIVVVPATVVSTTTSVTSTTVLSTSTFIATSTSTVTITRTGPVSTATTTVQVTYTQKQKKVGYPSCAYNRYYRAVSGVSGDPGPNNDFSVGLNQCQAACTADPRCKFFYYDAYDPAHTNGGFAGGECDLDDKPYDPALVQCNLPTRFGVGYQKN